MLDCLDNTHYLTTRISEIKGVKIVVEPQLNVVGLAREDNSSISQLNGELKKRNWKLGEFKKKNFLRIVCMPHVKKQHIDNFCIDLESILKKWLHIPIQKEFFQLDLYQ